MDASYDLACQSCQLCSVQHFALVILALMEVSAVRASLVVSVQALKYITA